MVVYKHGLADWNEETGKPGGNQKRDEFMRLQDGSNVVRIVTQPHQYYSHKFKEPGDPGFGDKIGCSMPTHKSCPVCAQKDRPKRRWFVGVIDRKTQTYKILDISYTVYQGIQNYNNTADYGNPSNYDIDIKVNRQGGATGYYGVIAMIPRPLSDNDIKTIATIDKESIVRRCAPPTPEKVLERWNSIREKKGLPPMEMPEASVAGTEKVGLAAPHPVINLESDESDFDFSAVETADLA